MSPPTFSLFFYGTLLHTSILSRVINRPDSSLTTTDALLESHCRFHIAGEDYPAVVSRADGVNVMGRELTPSEGCVRGALVSGLTEEDVRFLDRFEGEEYTRTPVSVVPLLPPSPPSPLGLPPRKGSLPRPLAQRVRTEVYLWTSPLSRLEPTLWSYEDFKRDKASRWVGVGRGSVEEYGEVDRRRNMRGVVMEEERVGEGEEKCKEGREVEFGWKSRDQWWGFEKGWTNVNHGSYGAPPHPVISCLRSVQDASNSAPDEFIRITYMPQLISLRARLAEFVNCDTDDLVLLGNATGGVNVVLRSLTSEWKSGDKLMYFSTTIYDACLSTLQHTIDTHPHLHLSLVPIAVEYPISHAHLVKLARDTIVAENKKGNGKVRLALVDAISSNPGVVVPWEELVGVFKEFDVISLVDAAHQIGQLPVNLGVSQPDYWISNCHKWLFGHRGCAVLYVAKHNQHLIHSLPVGHSYAIRAPSPNGVPAWVSEFEWNGTTDLSPLLSLTSALDFRLLLGGETRINTYCHDLALAAGDVVAGLLGTDVLENGVGEGTLVANMINVRLPIDVPPESMDAELRSKILKRQKDMIYFDQIRKYRTIAPGFIHAGKWYVRLSAQVYNQIEDYHLVGKALVSICREINDELGAAKTG